MMSLQEVLVATRSKYNESKRPVENRNEASSSSQPSNSIPPSPSKPLQIKKPNHDMMIPLLTKAVLQKSTFNLHARAAQNYNIIEDLNMSPSAISALEVLQTCPTQQRFYCQL